MNPFSQRLLKMVDGLNFKYFVAFLSAFSAKASMQEKVEFIFKVYDPDGYGKVSFNDILEVMQDLSGSFMSDEQREQVLPEVFKDAGYTRESYLILGDFIKVLGISALKMEVEMPVDKATYSSSTLIQKLQSFSILVNEKTYEKMQITPLQNNPNQIEAHSCIIVHFCSLTSMKQ